MYYIYIRNIYINTYIYIHIFMGVSKNGTPKNIQYIGHV